MLAASSSSVLAALAAGLGLCLSLIIAPGAQNVFLLRMGVQRRHAVALAITCLVSDAVLFTAGVAGFGVVVEHLPWLFELVRWAGVVFLAVYGLSAAWRALRPKRESIRLDEIEPEAAIAPAPSGRGGTATLTRPARTATGTLLPAVLACLAITWLNPHAYLDTVFLVGSVSASYGDLRWAFGLGAILGSAIWFSFLTVAARFAARRLRSPRAWRILDGLIAVAMLALAAGLAFS
ncbi:LysE/ArgO family amino acid transporter [Microbacterium lacusdiani]